MRKPTSNTHLQKTKGEKETNGGQLTEKLNEIQKMMQGNTNVKG